MKLFGSGSGHWPHFYLNETELEEDVSVDGASGSDSLDIIRPKTNPAKNGNSNRFDQEGQYLQEEEYKMYFYLEESVA